MHKTFNVYRPKAGARGLGRVRRERMQVRAVDGVSFSIDRGEMVGYVGPNGAGKSTTIKMLTGILVPSSGYVRVLDLEPTRQRVDLARRIGVVFGQRTQLWWDLPLHDSFDLLRHIYRVPEERFRVNLATFTDVLELEAFLATPVRQLSLGQRMRGDLAAALLHDPEILFLDEPTIGLDIVAKARIREFLAELNRERQTTIVLTTHDMDDIEQLCKRMMIIDHGRVIYDGDLETVRDRFGDESVLIVDLIEASPPIEVEGARVEKVEGPRQWLRFRRSEVTAASLIAAVAAQAELRDLTISDPDIEDVVRRIYIRGTGR
ncbi:MAG: ATP-binding cassette domain-containing protein [Actinomycetota bacterium]